METSKIKYGGSAAALQWAIAFVRNLQSLWPFSVFKHDDLKVSNELVRKLALPEHTKEFVFAIREPGTQSVIYILSALNLSERSAYDAECLIREVRPDAVVAQVGLCPAAEIQSEESELDDSVDIPVPTSSLGVIKRCFFDKISREKYESLAGNFVLREIFGISFHGHFLAAKRVADEVGSSFLVLESPLGKCSGDRASGEVEAAGNKFHGPVNSLVPQKAGSLASLNPNRFFLSNDVQSQMVKALSLYMDQSTRIIGHLISDSDVCSKEIQPRTNFEAPPFAKSIYPLLMDLHDIFLDLPSMGKALAHAQKMLFDVNRGEAVESRIISEVYTFRIAVEGLRIALNSSGRLPIIKKGSSNSPMAEFSHLPIEDQSHVLFAQALHSQTKKFKTIVAVVDATGLAGIRKHWNTHVPVEVNKLVGELVTNCEGEGDLNHTEKKRLLSAKPVVAVGAGATAVLGASSLSKVVPASTFMKVVSLKVPASMKLVLIQTKKAVAFALGKTLGPSQVVAPGFASSGAKTTSLLRSTASAEKIRTVAHSVIASAEKTSFSAMRTAFYKIMMKRRAQPVGFLPWATFVCSVGTCTGLLLYGDRIECAAESVPSAASIASLGRGIQHLRQASQAVIRTDGTRIQKSIESLVYRFKKPKVL
ncbi:Transmembrane protein [Quillaja saponaria]|uniref:Transmembrane protein n=1 Tax=Quillaja saponaria TaxID=32244 RepID=A0AAD7PJE5_QUISA|nr:Transmembrane protein [Quillaja saponaria]